LIIIGEKINVISIEIGGAMRERNAGPIQALAKAQVEAGANMLDINIGPAKKDGAELMPWLVETVQAVVDVPLSLDTTNAVAMEEGLKVHKGTALINSASGAPDRLHSMLGLAEKYNANVIGLTMTEKGIPRDANERMVIACEIMMAAQEHNIEPERLFFDPLILPVAVAQNQAMEGVEAIRMFKQLSDPPFRTTVGLSNISNNTPEKTKTVLDRAYLILLVEAGLDSAIMDPLETELVECAKTLPQELPQRLKEMEQDKVLARAHKIFKDEMLYAHSFVD
jgi:5-methyltetrahydrofolate corrinoid/iron sulfur protein methyltransferase